MNETLLQQIDQTLVAKRQTAWERYVALLLHEGDSPKNAAKDLESCMRELNLSTDQVREHIAIIDSHRKARELVGLHDEISAQRTAAARRVAKLRAELEEAIAGAEGEIKNARAVEYDLAAKLRRIGEASTQMARIERDFPWLVCGDPPACTVEGRKHWQARADKLEIQYKIAAKNHDPQQVVIERELTRVQRILANNSL